MKLSVKKRTADRLRLDLRSNSLILLFSGGLFVAMGIITIWAVGVRTVLEVDGEGLSFEKSRFGRQSPDSFVLPAAEIEGIEIVLREGGISPSYEMVVKTADGDRDTAFPNADGDRKRELVAQSLEVLSGGGEAFRHEDDGAFVGLLLGLVCIGGGLLCWRAIQKVAVVGDRDAGTLSIRRKPRRLGRESLRLEEIVGVGIGESVFDTGRHRVVSYQVEIELRDGTKIPVAVGPAFTDASAEKTRTRLDEWIAGRSA